MSSKLSIIIPVYNVEKYISRCLDSIINQTFEDFEVICINSNSPDNSMEILSEYAMEDKRIKIICQEDNGPGAARNLGLAHAKGEFISFVDGDDWIELNTYEKTIIKMTDDVDIVHFGANIITEDITEEDLKSVEESRKHHKIKYEGLFDINNLLILNSTTPLWNKIYRNNLIKKHEIMFPSGLACEDMIFFYKYSLISKKAYYVGDYLYNYLRRGDSRTSQGYKKVLPSFADRTLTCYDLYKFLKSENILQENIAIFELTFENLFKADLSQCPDKNRNELFQIANDITNKMEI